MQELLSIQCILDAISVLLRGKCWCVGENLLKWNLGYIKDTWFCGWLNILLAFSGYDTLNYTLLYPLESGINIAVRLLIF